MLLSLSIELTLSLDNFVLLALELLRGVYNFDTLCQRVVDHLARFKIGGSEGASESDSGASLTVILMINWFGFR